MDVDLSIIRKAVDNRLESTAGFYNDEVVDNNVVKPILHQKKSDKIQPIQQVEYTSQKSKNDNSNTAAPKTVGFFKINEAEPVVGWIVCMNKDMRGQDYRLVEGRNIISNEIDAEISLPEMKDGSGGMSIMYDSINDSYFIQSGASDVSVNGEKVIEATSLEGQCVIDIDEYNLVFIPFCEMGRNWNE